MAPSDVGVILVATSSPVDELNVMLVPVFGPMLPVAAVENIGKQVVSELSSATVIAVGIPPAVASSDINWNCVPS